MCRPWQTLLEEEVCNFESTHCSWQLGIGTLPPVNCTCKMTSLALLGSGSCLSVHSPQLPVLREIGLLEYHRLPVGRRSLLKDKVLAGLS